MNLTALSPVTLILAAALVLAICVALWMYIQKQRTQKLRSKFGPEPLRDLFYLRRQQKALPGTGGVDEIKEDRLAFERSERNLAAVLVGEGQIGQTIPLLSRRIRPDRFGVAVATETGSDHNRKHTR